jgi:hypothetical protein
MGLLSFAHSAQRQRGSNPRSRISESGMNVPANRAWAPNGSDVFHVDQLAHRYARVLLSRRVLRALAAGTLSATFLLLVVSAAVPVGIYLVEAASDAGSVMRLALAALLILVIAAGAAGLVVLYVRVLSALARGSRRMITAVVAIATIWIVFVGISDLVLAIFPEGDASLHLFAYGAFLVHLLMAAGVVIGPLEMRRADEFSQSVYADPRPGTGLVAELAKLLDLPDLRAFARSARTKAWLLVILSLALEGLAFQTFLRWGMRLADAAERQPGSISSIDRAVLIPGLIVFLVATLAFSFWLIRLMLIGARRLRLKARRIALQPADEVVAADPRPPVLFLRSFEEEQVPLTAARTPWLLRGFDPGSEYRTLEEMIVLNLTYVGPVVAVADPSRGELPVGAARWRVRDEEWQQFVESKIREAAVIVVGVSDTDGLRWEIEALRRTPGALAKTIFVCPPGMTRNRALMSDLAAVFGLAGGLGSLDEQTHILAAAQVEHRAPTWFVASALSEVAYYVALRACLVRHSQSAVMPPTVASDLSLAPHT